ncbi:MAG: ribokinase [Coleofasciculus sp. S288]|nr:ribokinase [Coleofasciculus sp. S288]
MTKVIVFGSINMDLVTRTPRLPVAGETLQGTEFFTASGGKGANQAVAAARLGIPTQLVGRLGGDDFGRQLLAGLQASGVQIDGVLVDEATSSGVAIITVDGAGENTIVIIAGANGRIDEADIDRLKSRLAGTAALLMQFEIPLSMVHSAALAARQAGVPVILDPAPVQDIPVELYPLVDIITPNQLEASQLVGFPVDGIEAAQRASAILRQRGVGTAIVKLGDRGVFCATTEETFFVPAFPVEAVDTVAAGDAFDGALAVALAEGLPLQQAVMWGAAAGALSATKAGAQPSLPDRKIFDAFLKERGLDMQY